MYLSFCVCTYHVHNNYVTDIVAMQRSLSRLRQFRWLLSVATVISLAQYEFEMETEKQRQCRHNDAKKRAATRDAYRVAKERNREWLPGELLNGSERLRPCWLLDMEYQTC